jgi:hypothetical protein
MKKNYSKPAMRVVEIKQRNLFLMASQRMYQMNSNAGIDYEGDDSEYIKGEGGGIVR